MSYDKAIKQYTSANHATENKARQVVMLYDGAINYVNKVKFALENNDIETRYNFIEKATNIINGLQASLDFEKGGEIAKLLDDYYFSIYMRLTSINFSNNIEICESVIKELKMMRDAWVEVEETTSSNDDDPMVELSSAKNSSFDETIVTQDNLSHNFSI